MFMSEIRRYLDKVNLLGLRSQDSYEFKKRVILLNKLIILVLFVTIIFSIIFTLLSSVYIGVFVWCTDLVFFICLGLSAKRYFTCSKVFLIVGASILAWFCAGVYGPSSGVPACFSFVFLLSFSILDKNEKYLLFSMITIPLLLYSHLVITEYQFFYLYELPSFNEKFLSIAVMIGLFVMAKYIIDYLLDINSYLLSLNEKMSIYPSLTKREAEVVTILIQGKTNKQIAMSLFLSESTVKNHFKNIFKKLNVKNRLELMKTMSSRVTTPNSSNPA
jgi:DNA-binding CsgD family transcriptional regulator